MIDYFKRLTDRLFKVDDRGRSLFYPWGSLGKGYIVADKQIERNIRLFVAYYYAVCFVLMVGLLFTGYMKYSYVLILPVFIVWAIGVRYFTQNLETTEIKLTFTESMTRFAKTRSKAILLLTVIIGCSLVVLSIQTYLSQRSAWAGLAVIFFVALTAVNGYVLYRKDK
jgi:hypothetical protein